MTDLDDLFPRREIAKKSTNKIVPKSTLMNEFKPKDWLKPSEISKMFGVKPRTVHRWAKSHVKMSKIRHFATPGGHKRYYRPDIEAILKHEDTANRP